MVPTVLLLAQLLGCAGAAAQGDCERSCDAQAAQCATLDREGCSDLCEWAVAVGEGQPGCLELLRAAWQCDEQADWTCSDETDIVAQPADDRCEPEHEAAAGCGSTDRALPRRAP